MLAIMKKELKNYFVSPIGYIYIGIFLLACSFFFYVDLYNYRSADFSSVFGYTIYIVLFIIPVLTMKMFSEERKTGTEQLLLTSPKSITQIVLGKFFAATIVVLISILSTLLFFIVLLYFGKPHIATILVSILGYSLLCIAYVSFGMFASSITENQIISAIISIGFFIGLWLLPNVVPVFENFSLINACEPFLYGMISFKSTVLLISFTLLFIILTIVVLQKRKLVK